MCMQGSARLAPNQCMRPGCCLHAHASWQWRLVHGSSFRLLAAGADCGPHSGGSYPVPLHGTVASADAAASAPASSLSPADPTGLCFLFAIRISHCATLASPPSPPPCCVCMLSCRYENSVTLLQGRDSIIRRFALLPVTTSSVKVQYEAPMVLGATTSG